MAGILPGRRNRKFLMVCHSRRCRIFFMGVCGRQTFSGQYRVCKRQYSLLHQQNQIRGSVLFAHSIEMANFGRKIFEREILSVDASTLAYRTPPTAKERYLTLMEENPELLQDVPLKYLASYLYITPQSLSRIRAGLREKEDVSK